MTVPAATGTGRLAAAWGRVEDGLAVSALLLMAVLPVLELVLRGGFATGIAGTSGYVQHLTLWTGFLGAMVTTREGRHLALSPGEPAAAGPRWHAARLVSATISTAVATGLAWASFVFVRAEIAAPARIAGWLPVWVAESVLPLAFAVIALRFVARAGGPRARAVAALGIPAAWLFGVVLAPYGTLLFWPGVLGLVGAALVGTPIFVVLGGAALLLFHAAGVPTAAIPVEAYRIIVSPAIPTIPLFTLAGYALAEGGASRRLTRLFRALFGWIPGGLAVATTLVCAFFTTFTGASGVTILALGGLLLPVLVEGRYPARFAVGLLTATGSIGLLFPPSLAVILYGVVAHVPIPDLFVAGLVPGALMVLAVAVFGVRAGLAAKSPRPPFEPREALTALWEAKWEVLLPVVALGGIFGGMTTLLEAAAITAVYALVSETVVHRELRLGGDLGRALVTCVTLIGGIFVIIGAAMGLTSYLVDAEVPMRATEWVRAHIDSPVVFLLVLNVFLLLVGCVLDIFSAIVVVLPLILPLGEAFGVHPLHLGMVFLANLQLGYLTPPVGMNLFFASYRFDRPLVEVYRATVPFLLLLLAVVLLITYVPALTIGAATQRP